MAPIRTPKATKPKITWPRPLVGVLLERSVSHADKVIWPLMAIAAQGWPFIKIDYGRTDFIRNKMAIHLLRSNFTHLIMLDIDHVHPIDIVQRLMKPFQEMPDLRVVGGLNFRRGEPFDPCAFIQGKDQKFYPLSEWPEGLVKVDAVGTGCIAIAREVFEVIEPPWFFNDYGKVLQDIWPGEDMGFAAKCKEYGIDQHVLTTLTSPHLIDAVVEEQSYRMYIEEKGYSQSSLEEITGEEPAAEFTKLDDRTLEVTKSGKATPSQVINELTDGDPNKLTELITSKEEKDGQ